MGETASPVPSNPQETASVEGYDVEILDAVLDP
jgi:hypothetical protein